MGKFIAAAGLVAVVAFVALSWVGVQRHKILTSRNSSGEERRPSISGTEQQWGIQDQLTLERNRLANLQSRLTTVQAMRGEPNEPVEAQLAGLTTRIQDIEAKMRALQEERKDIALRTEFYNSDQRLQILNSEAELQARLEDLNAELIGLQTRIQELSRAPAGTVVLPEMGDLSSRIEIIRSQQDQILNQMRGLHMAAQRSSLQIGLGAMSANETLRVEEQELERQLNSLRTEFRYWNEQKAVFSQNAVARQEEIRELEAAVAAQAAVVAEAERKLMALDKK